MIGRLRERNEWHFFAVLLQADRGLALCWWALLLARALLPAGFAMAMGVLIGTVQREADITLALVEVGLTFVLMQVLPPFHRAVSANLGSRVAAHLHAQLMRACTIPPGIGHLEHPKLIGDLSMARDFDLGISGPPLAIAMDFIASGLVELVGGLASALVLSAYAWWAPPLLIAGWGCTHWLLRESGVWYDRNTSEVRDAQRHADYAYRLAVEAPAAKELRLFGLADWTIERFSGMRKRLFELQWKATRLRERPVALCLLLVTAANLVVFGALAAEASRGTLSIDRLIAFATAAAGAGRLAFGGLTFALDVAASAAGAAARLPAAMAEAGALEQGSASPAADRPHSIAFRDVSFAYPGCADSVLQHFDLEVPAGTSLAIVGVNGAGKTTLAKLLCRLYDPQSGAIEIDGVDLRTLDPDAWRARLSAVFQDFIRFELSLRDNVAPAGAADDHVRAALGEAGAAGVAGLDTVLARGYEGGTELSGGQWQRVALARAMCAVHGGAGVVLLDEPTAQLDVRGESEIFERILGATRDTTLILISHRFATVRLADRICVLENGAVVELGSHDQLMAQGGRYRTMFDLQASRFHEPADEEGIVYDRLG